MEVEIATRAMKIDLSNRSVSCCVGAFAVVAWLIFSMTMPGGRLDQLLAPPNNADDCSEALPAPGEEAYCWVERLNCSSVQHKFCQNELEAKLCVSCQRKS